jgi:hypothetical protein
VRPIVAAASDAHLNAEGGGRPATLWGSSDGGPNAKVRRVLGIVAGAHPLTLLRRQISARGFSTPLGGEKFGGVGLVRRIPSCAIECRTTSCATSFRGTSCSVSQAT